MKMKAFLVIIPFILAGSLAPVPRAAATANAIVQNDSMWIDSAGYLHIFGEVKNTGDVWLRYVQITATLRDASSSIVDVVFTFTSTDFLPPDSVAPFNIVESDTAKSARVQTYSLVVEFREATAIAQKLVIMSVGDSKNSLGWLEVVGEVENQGDALSTYTEVVGTFYDVNGKVVYVGFTFASPSDVPPASKYGFKITVSSDERTNQIGRYSLIAESQNYTSVPELSAPMLVAGIVLSMGVLALWKKRHDFA
jgi:hypothetical protein